VQLQTTHIALPPPAASSDCCQLTSFDGFTQDGLGQDPEILRDFGGVGDAALGAVMSQQRQFRATKVTRYQVLLHQRPDHRRQLLRMKGKQGRRRRTGGRFSECELWLRALHFFPGVSPYKYCDCNLDSSTFPTFSSVFFSKHSIVKTCCSFFKMLLPCLASVMSQPGL
jgi:hypothetical protein